MRVRICLLHESLHTLGRSERIDQKHFLSS
jgi:hypothetical protein